MKKKSSFGLGVAEPKHHRLRVKASTESLSEQQSVFESCRYPQRDKQFGV